MYEVKAALLFKIARFVEWPASSFDPALPELRLCVIGEDPFGAALDSLAGKQVQGRAVRILRARQPGEHAAECHIAFLNEPNEKRLRAWLRALDGAPVLTVGDVDGFSHNGGTVNLLIRDRRVKFEVNVTASELAGLKISAQLLQLATIVGTRS